MQYRIHSQILLLTPINCPPSNKRATYATTSERITLLFFFYNFIRLTPFVCRSGKKNGRVCLLRLKYLILCKYLVHTFVHFSIIAAKKSRIFRECDDCRTVTPQNSILREIKFFYYPNLGGSTKNSTI